MTPAPNPSEPPERGGPESERRVCSVLFADLVGFTTLSESRDPEEVRELLGRYFDVSRTVIGRYGGVVEKFIGDAVMAVWGTPVAEEGDAERAVRAALDLVEAVADLGSEVHAPELCARAGVVTGEVAVTLGATGQGMVAGDAVNTAARVQSAADPGAVLVDEGTYRLVRSSVSFETTGAHDLKGKAEAVELWRADRVMSGVGGAQRVDGLEAPFVGRDAELRLVKELFHACVERRTPRLLSVTGGAGLGKSRLGWEFEKYIDGLASTVRWHRGRCLSYGEGVAFWALVEMVRQRMDIAEDDLPAVAAEKFESGLVRWVPDREDRDYIAPRLGQLLGIAGHSSGPDLAQDELFAGWRLFFERLAAETPVVLLVEDLQLADTGLLDFFEHLLDWARDVPVFVLTLARPDLETRRAGWGLGRRNSSTIALDALGDGSMEALLDGLVPGMPASAKDTIAAQAEGVPLYAVETVRMLIDRDVVQPVEGVYRLVGSVGELTVPATLQSLLAARLDALDPDSRMLVADAAVLGGTFPRESLVAVSGRPADEVDRLLSELVRAEVLGIWAERLSPQRGQYGFVQTMLRQVAYDTLSRRERKARHLAVARHMQDNIGAGGDELPEVVAAHLLDALRAVPGDLDVPELRVTTAQMLTQAGERAVRAGAPASAARAFTSAAQLYEQAGSAEDEVVGAERLQQAATALEAVNSDQSAILHERAADIYRRHGRIRDAAGADTQRARALRRLGRIDEARAPLQSALSVLEAEPDDLTVRALAEAATLEIFAGGDLKLADRLSAKAFAYAQAHDAGDAVMADLCVVRGLLFVFSSRTVEAAAYLREGIRRGESAQRSDLTARAMLNLADLLAAEDPRAAVTLSRGSVERCLRVGDNFSLSVALYNLAQGLIFLGDWGEAQAVIDSISDNEHLGGDAFVEVIQVMLSALRGDAEHADLRLRAMRDAWVDSDDLQATSARDMCEAALAAAKGDHEQALTHAWTVVSAYGTGRGDPIRWSWSVAADAALALGDLEAAQRAVDWLDALPPGHVEPLLRAERLRITARLLDQRQDPAAADVFERAVGALRQVGSPYHLALGLLDHAGHLAGDNPVAAAPLAEEAGEIARTLGAPWLARRADQLGTVSTLTR